MNVLTYCDGLEWMMGDGGCKLKILPAIDNVVIFVNKN